MKTIALALLLALCLIPAGAIEARETQASATLARDVAGIELGMTFDQIRTRMTLEHVAFETYRGSAGGIAFDLGFTPAGRVFRIESRQSLGEFQTDAQFSKELEGRLAAKYGPPSQSGLPDGPAYWQLVQHVRDAGGNVVSQTVMWANAILSSDEDGRTLEITLLDFRILWADQARKNHLPSQEAAKAIRF